MKIFVKTKKGTHFEIEVKSHDSVMSIICTMALRSSDNAARVVEAEQGTLPYKPCRSFLEQHNRTILLINGIEGTIRKAKENHESCKDATTDALRDFGLDNYNL